jgi:hypothetical protein
MMLITRARLRIRPVWTSIEQMVKIADPRLLKK